MDTGPKIRLNYGLMSLRVFSFVITKTYNPIMGPDEALGSEKLPLSILWV